MSFGSRESVACPDRGWNNRLDFDHQPGWWNWYTQGTQKPARPPLREAFRRRDGRFVPYVTVKFVTVFVTVWAGLRLLGREFNRSGGLWIRGACYPIMADAFDRLKSALADRYAIERELGSGGMAYISPRTSSIGVEWPSRSSILNLPERWDQSGSYARSKSLRTSRIHTYFHSMIQEKLTASCTT